MDAVSSFSSVPASSSPVTSVRSFAVGDVVFSCEPWIWCFNWSTYENVCAYCFKIRGGRRLQSCSRCRVHRYCDKTCQTADWKKEHKIECEGLQELGLPHVSHSCTLSDCDTIHAISDHTQYLLLMWKLAKRLQLDVLHELPGGKRTVQQILSMFRSHPRPEDAELRTLVMKLTAAPLIKMWSGMAAKSKSPIPSFDDCLKIIMHNGLPIRNSQSNKTQILGMALFPHALHWNMTPVCWDINITMDFIGRRLVIHAAEEIPNYTGLQDLRYNELLQVPFNMTRQERRYQFLGNYGHPCTCRKCTKEYEAEINPLKCVTVNCMERLPSDARALEPCPQCGALNADRLRKFQAFMKECIAIRYACHSDELFDEKRFDLLKDIDAAGIIHEDAHIRFVCGWDLACTSVEKDYEYEYAWKLFQQLIPCMRRIYPKLHVGCGLCLKDAGSGPVLGVAKLTQDLTFIPPGVSKSDLLSSLYAKYPEVHGLLTEARDILVELCGEDSRRAEDLSYMIMEVEEHMKNGQNRS